MPLADDDLIALLRKEEEAASGYQDAALSAVREEALAYYDRQPYGDEQEGASQIVTSEFADVVESLMPGLMRVFTGADDLASSRRRRRARRSGPRRRASTCRTS